MVPGGVVDIDETDSSLDEPPRQQTISRKGPELSRSTAAVGFNLRIVAFHAIGFQGRFAFTGKIDQFRRGTLHMEGQFVGGNSAGNLGITNFFIPKAIK